eukprot:Nk52_evm18s281 gene=Nk52_evmTU18s281
MNSFRKQFRKAGLPKNSFSDQEYPVPRATRASSMPAVALMFEEDVATNAPSACGFLLMRHFEENNTPPEVYISVKGTNSAELTKVAFEFSISISKLLSGECVDIKYKGKSGSKQLEKAIQRHMKNRGAGGTDSSEYMKSIVLKKKVEFNFKEFICKLTQDIYKECPEVQDLEISYQMRDDAVVVSDAVPKGRHPCGSPSAPSRAGSLWNVFRKKSATSDEDGESISDNLVILTAEYPIRKSTDSLAKAICKKVKCALKCPANNEPCSLP